ETKLYGLMKEVDQEDQRMIKDAMQLDAKLYEAFKLQYERQMRSFQLLVARNRTYATDLKDVYYLMHPKHSAGARLAKTFKELGAKWIDPATKRHPLSKVYCGFEEEDPSERWKVVVEKVYERPEQHVQGCQFISGNMDWTLGSAINSVTSSTTRLHPIIYLSEPIFRSWQAMEFGRRELHQTLNRFKPMQALEWLSVCNGQCTKPGWAKMYCQKLGEPHMCKVAGACGMFENYQTHMVAASSYRRNHMCELQHGRSEVLLSQAIEHIDLPQTGAPPGPTPHPRVLLTGPHLSITTDPPLSAVLEEQMDISMCLILHHTGQADMFDRWSRRPLLCPSPCPSLVGCRTWRPSERTGMH
ncbi:hypothetical protein CYMTET_26172, partial [Cymbomonas tetramitiformis]